MKTYVSRSGRDCSWKIPKACMNSCWNVPTLWILLNSIKQTFFGYWKSKILSLWIATSANGEDLLSVICPSDVTVTSTTLENSYILILTLPWLQVDTCSKSIISFSICNSIQKSFFQVCSISDISYLLESNLIDTTGDKRHIFFKFNRYWNMIYILVIPSLSRIQNWVGWIWYSNSVLEPVTEKSLSESWFSLTLFCIDWLFVVWTTDIIFQQIFWEWFYDYEIDRK